MLFITSTSQATRHGVYAVDRAPPPAIRASGTTVSAIVEMFPWGPDGVVYESAGTKDFIETFCPGGADRTGAGYLTVTGKAWPSLKIVRVVGTDADYATASVASGNITLTAKYKGDLGSSLVWYTEAATDGDMNHFNLRVVLDNALGTTEDKFENLNYSGTGDDSAPSFEGRFLIGAITKNSPTTVAPDQGTFTGGTDGTINSAAYVGTEGAADVGIALLETDKTIDAVMTADPGNALRAAVNAGLAAHADYMTDRVAFINGDSGMTANDARTDVADYRSYRVCYQDVWAYRRDDVDGTERLVPPAPFAASVAANLSPSTSFSWKSTTAQRLMSSITKLETNRGNAAYGNELAGINTLQREEGGGYTFECAVVTAAPQNPAKKKFKRTRMGHYMAKAVVSSLREYVDSPNVPQNQSAEELAVFDFLDGLKANASRDANSLPHILDFAMHPREDFNDATTVANGEFTIASDVTISSDQEKIYFSLQYGETVRVSATL